MRGNLILLVMVLMLTGVSAQLDVRLVEYNLDNQLTKLEVYNIHTSDLTGVKIFLGDVELDEVGTIGSGSSVISIMSVPSGMHVVKVSSNEGISFEGEINFLKTQQEIEEELVAEKDARDVALNKQVEVQRQARENEQILKLKNEDGNGSGVAWSVAIVILLAGLAWYFTKK